MSVFAPIERRSFRGFLRVLLTPVGEIFHSKAPLIKVHEYTGDFILRDRRLSTRVCVRVCARACVCV